MQRNDQRRSVRRTTRVLGAAAVAALALSACGTTVKTSADGGSGASGGYSKKLSVLFVSAGATSDVFWASAQKGAKQAASDENASFEYLSPDAGAADATAEAKLLQAAIAKKPDAIVVADAFPSALDPLIKQATGQGIAVVVTNSGQDTWKATGAVAYVGQSDFDAGVGAGKQMAAAGVTSAICENVPGFQVSMQRCAGFAQGFAAGGGKAINVDLVLAKVGDPTYVQRALEATLTSHPEAQAIMATGVIGWTPAVAALSQAGKTDKIKLATFDLSTADLQATADGKNLFLVDQQPYLEGYDSVQAALQYVRFGLLPANGTIATGPNLITKDTAAAVLKYNSLGVRGAS